MLKMVLFVTGVSMSALTAVCIGVGHKYGLPAQSVVKEMLRKAGLSLIWLLTRVYDPSFCRPVVTAPASTEDKPQQAAARLEEFVRAAGPGNRVRIVEICNAAVTGSRFDFRYQPWEEPRLHELRAKYRLDEVVAPAQSEFESQVLLRNWARSQLRRNDFQPVMDNFDALAVLDRDVRNTQDAPFDPAFHYDPCHFFPLFYSQILLSMGHQPRICRISSKGYHTGHGVVEVWSNQYRKWVAMDAELNLHYEKQGRPLNLLEIHNERGAGAAAGIAIVRGEQRSGDVSTTGAFLQLQELDIQNMIRYHGYFGIVDMRNDWMTNYYFPGHPKRSDFSQLFWHDRNMPPSFTWNPKTSAEADFYWPLNLTEILAAGWRNKHLHVRFRTFTPNFDHFEISLNRSDQVELQAAEFCWKLNSDVNELRVAAVNKFGVSGPASRVVLAMAPQQAGRVK